MPKHWFRPTTDWVVRPSYKQGAIVNYDCRLYKSKYVIPTIKQIGKNDGKQVRTLRFPRKLENGLWESLYSTLISSLFWDSGSFPTTGKILIFPAFDTRSAIDNVILRWVWLFVECGLNVNFSRKIAWAWRPVPYREKKSTIIQDLSLFRRVLYWYLVYYIRTSRLHAYAKTSTVSSSPKNNWSTRALLKPCTTIKFFLSLAGDPRRSFWRFKIRWP